MWIAWLYKGLKMSRLQISEYQEIKCQEKTFDHVCVVNSSLNVLVSKMIKSNGFDFECIEKSQSVAPLANCIESHVQRKNRNKQQKLVDNTCSYLRERLHEKHMLDDVACEMGTNRSKLAASFKCVIGKGVFEWLRERRMIKAKALLLMTELSIQQVAFEVGFDNCANFSTAFKKQYGISPRQQRTVNVLAK